MPEQVAPGRHYPNPFDFVPIPDQPTLRTREQFDALGPRLTGYLDVTLTALTPVHVVGGVTRVEEPGDGATRRKRRSDSAMHREDGRACIPASEVRGCLRAFVEALTKGWVSQTAEEYEKVRGVPGHGGRHLGWRAFEPYTPRYQRTPQPPADPAISPAFQPRYSAEGLLDVASYLFGTVIEPQQDERTKTKHEGLAAKSKVWIEDAFILEPGISRNEWWMPDVGSDAFMGGGKPNRSNWWYFQPAYVWKRVVNGEAYAEFSGSKYWGRKFYYHQEPEACIAVYDGDREDCKWPYPNGFEKVWLEAVKAGATTEPFRIYFDHLPLPLLTLLLLVLQPGRNIRHKLGYGKAFGYGSVEFTVTGTYCRQERTRPGIPAPLVRIDLPAPDWDPATLPAAIRRLLDPQALIKLGQILNWPDHKNLIFTYPPYQNTDYLELEFGHTLRYEDFSAALFKADRNVPLSDCVAMDEQLALKVAKELLNLKRPLHFRLYQELSKGWSRIKARVP